MEPVTHMLTGAVLGRSGFNRKAAYATWAMVIAAEFPDIDVVMGQFGPVMGLEHHRGITHTFIGLPVEAALIVGGFWVFDRVWRGRRGKEATAKAKANAGVLRFAQDDGEKLDGGLAQDDGEKLEGKQLSAKRSVKPGTKAPVRWGWLYLGVLVALLSHILLDWTNNYGVRPFFPFNPQWFAGSFIFIFEPVLFLILVAALVLPGLFGLINAEVGARRPLFRGRASAIVALLAVVVLYFFRFDQRNQALKLAATVAPAEATRYFASPYPVDPFRWHVVTETPEKYLLSTFNNRETAPNVPEMTVYKSAPTLPVLAAKRTYLGKIYLDWSQFPVITEATDSSDPNHPLSLVTFADVRFFYNVSFFHGVPENGKAPPLSGSVLLDMAAPEGERVVETRMGAKVQR